MDAHGVPMLQRSCDHLALSGQLVVFGFPSNLPTGSAMVSPLEWMWMAKKMVGMPRFDAMDLTVPNKSVWGFNLPFFAEEVERLSYLFDQIMRWVEEGKLRCPMMCEMVIREEWEEFGEDYFDDSGCLR